MSVERKDKVEEGEGEEGGRPSINIVIASHCGASWRPSVSRDVRGDEVTSYFTATRQHLHLTITTSSQMNKRWTCGLFKYQRRIFCPIYTKETILKSFSSKPRIDHQSRFHQPRRRTRGLSRSNPLCNSSQINLIYS